MSGYDFEKPFTRQEDMPQYLATDPEVGRRYGRTVKALSLSNAEYDLRYRRLNAVNSMKPPPSHSRIFGGYLVIRNLGSSMQYETWMPDHAFEEVYAATPVPPDFTLKNRVAIQVQEHATLATPNPSIEGMPKRLRLLCTPHVKR